MSITSKPFGSMPDGTSVTLYTLTNKNGLKAEIINYGGIVVSLYVPDKDGKFADIELGYDNLEDYLDRSPSFGALIGRHANRLEGASFVINGITYNLNKNEGNNQLHGGLVGFDKRVWDAKIIYQEKEALELSLFSPDMDENYPGNLEVRVIYRLTDEDALEIEYYAASDKDTVLNMTNHSYFNLSGHDSGTVLNHELRIDADFYTPINSESLQTGEILSVKNTPFDFTSPKRLGEGLSDFSGNEQMEYGSGYDHNFVLRNSAGNEFREIAEVYDPKSGRVMTVFTTKPGVQLYTGNHLKSAGKGKGGHIYDKWHGLCLETQYFPNSMKQNHFPSPVLIAGQTYHHKTVYKFSTR
ncbi:MAG: aldose epimerase family protein [Acetivibrionales bacterium]